MLENYVKFEFQYTLVKFYWAMSTFIYLHIVEDCFCGIMTERTWENTVWLTK